MRKTVVTLCALVVSAPLFAFAASPQAEPQYAPLQTATERPIIVAAANLDRTDGYAFIDPQETVKNLCVLHPENCKPSASDETIQRKVQIIEKEIDKGTPVYSKAELNLLQERLHHYESILAP